MLVAVGLIASLTLASAPTPVQAVEKIELVLDGQIVVPVAAPLMEQNRVYVPLRFFANRLEASIQWEQATRAVSITTADGDSMRMSLNSYYVWFNGKKYFMDAKPLIQEGRVYLPLRYVAEVFHMNVNWDQANSRVQFESVTPYEVLEQDSLDRVAEQFGTTASLLAERNTLESQIVNPGTKLRVVIPTFMKNQVTEEMMLLAKLIYLEAGAESLVGQMAVGKVIMNRIEDARFPDSVSEVIYQQGQFSTASDLKDTVPSEESIYAAMQVLNGGGPAIDAIYFFNPDRTSNAFLRSLDVVENIGNHRFAK